MVMVPFDDHLWSVAKLRDYLYDFPSQLLMCACVYACDSLLCMGVWYLCMCAVFYNILYITATGGNGYNMQDFDLIKLI